MVPTFVLATVLLQDGLINGDGRSWQRAAQRAAVPTAAACVAGFAFATWQFSRRGPRRRAIALAAMALNAAGLAFIAYATLTT
jgi:hypothetical protein